MVVADLYHCVFVCVFSELLWIFQNRKMFCNLYIELFKLVTFLHDLVLLKIEGKGNFLFFWSDFPLLFWNLKTLISGSPEPCGGKNIGNYSTVRNCKLNSPETSVFDFPELFKLFGMSEKKSPILFGPKSCLIFFSPEIFGGKNIWWYKMIQLSFFNNSSLSNI